LSSLKIQIGCLLGNADLTVISGNRTYISSSKNRFDQVILTRTKGDKFNSTLFIKVFANTVVNYNFSVIPTYNSSFDTRLAQAFPLQESQALLV
jgi:hypothetical protein